MYSEYQNELSELTLWTKSASFQIYINGNPAKGLVSMIALRRKRYIINCMVHFIMILRLTFLPINYVYHKYCLSQKL